MKSKSKSKSIFLPLICLSFSGATFASVQPFFSDTFDTAETAINAGIGDPRQTGSLLPVTGAYWFLADPSPTAGSPALIRPKPAIASNAMKFDGTTGVGGNSSSNLDIAGLLLRSSATYDNDNLPETPEVSVEGNTGAALNFGGAAGPTSIVGTHYTIKATIETGLSPQVVDRLGIYITSNPIADQNFLAVGKVMATVQDNGAISTAVAGVVNSQLQSVTTFIDSTGGSIPTSNSTTTPTKFAIDIDESQGIFTIYMNRNNGTYRPIQTGTINMSAQELSTRYIGIWGNGNVAGNTVGTVDDVIVEKSQFPTPVVPLIWKGQVVVAPGANVWNTAEVNWDKNTIPLAFTNGVPVIFDATANQYNIDITEEVSPSIITVSSATDYRFFSSGTGSIIGGPPVQKSGTGNLRFETANILGGITIAQGSITATKTDSLGNSGVSLNANTLNFESPVTPMEFTNRFGGTSSSAPGKIIVRNPEGFDPAVGPGTGTVVTLSGTEDNGSTTGTVQAHTTLILNKVSTTGGTGVNAIGAGGTFPSLTVDAQGSVLLAGTGGNQIDEAAIVTINGTLDMNGNGEALNALNGQGIVKNTNAVPATPQLLISSGSWSGEIKDDAGKLNLRKNSTGTLDISAPQTFSGSLIVGDGKVALTGSGEINQASGINLLIGTSSVDCSGATTPIALSSPTSLISGIGSFTGNVSTLGKINPGATGNSLTSTLTFTGNLSIPGTYEVNLDQRRDNPVNATATAVITDGVITGIQDLVGGQVYTASPFVTITGDGSGATATASMANGVVTAITITNGGIGYTSATVTIAAPTSGLAPNDLINISGDLTLPPGSTLAILPQVTATEFPFTIATYGGTLTGTFTNVPSGFDLDYTSAPGQIRLIAASLTGYALWASTNAGGQSANLDFDLDGMSNGIEYFMGATGSSFTPNPQPVGSTVTWPKDPTATNVTPLVQTSTNLVTWVPAVGVINNADSLRYTITGPDKQFVRLSVTVP